MLDPLRRLAINSSIKAKEARKARFSKYDAKRKNLQEEEERERVFKKQKLDKVNEDRRRETANERIKEQGRRMREEKEAGLKRTDDEAADLEDAAANDETEIPTLGNLDTTVKIKYNLADYPELKSTSALASLLSQFGYTDESSIVLSMKTSKESTNQTSEIRHCISAVQANRRCICRSLCKRSRRQETTRYQHFLGGRQRAENH